MSVLDRERLDALVTRICEELDGEWLLIGGAIVALWLQARRTTEDVDIIGLAGTSRQRLALMSLAEAEGLPVEAVNSAADFFVERVDGWRSHLVVFREGKRGTVYRPDATLFLLLKIHRLDEQDLSDCAALLASGEPFDAARVRTEIRDLPVAASREQGARRAELLRLVGLAPGPKSPKKNRTKSRKKPRAKPRK